MNKPDPTYAWRTVEPYGGGWAVFINNRAGVHRPLSRVFPTQAQAETSKIAWDELSEKLLNILGHVIEEAMEHPELLRKES